MTYYIDIQHASDNDLNLSDDDITKIAHHTLRDYRHEAELTIRLVACSEIQNLNRTYRQQDKTTNVLAFPSELPTAIQLDCEFLGDVIICPQVLLNESIELKKSFVEHFTLILMHGILHLLGYDHIKDKDAATMQAIEINLLAELGYANPYDIEEI